MHILIILVQHALAWRTGLFGGGCLVENDKLTVSGAFELVDGQPARAKAGYQLKLHAKLVLPADNRLPWDEVVQTSSLPGELRNFTHKTTTQLAYVLGGLFERNTVDFNPLNREPLHRTTDEEYLAALTRGLEVGAFENGRYFLMFKLGASQPVLSEITTAASNSSSVSFTTTFGPHPPYQAGFSAAHHRGAVYLVTNGHVHILKLGSLTWEDHPVPGLVAAQSGCLHLYGSTLIHAFGRVGAAYSSTTQFIDTATWTLAREFDPRPAPKPAATAEKTLLAVLLSLAFLLLVPACVYAAIRFHRYRTRIPPPEFYTGQVWAEHSLSSYSVDLSHNIDDPAPEATPQPILPSLPADSLFKLNRSDSE